MRLILKVYLNLIQFTEVVIFDMLNLKMQEVKITICFFSTMDKWEVTVEMVNYQ